ncbi:MAG TPA: xanthine dehydrogenase family protein molybdopterin-binding subunit, partial [Solirubrobacteraceae bacterium]|nr:xanthine dehydrogenase family protein molybdopterin-binding subunit [Solirubrobacteraceae bacterium]
MSATATRGTVGAGIERADGPEKVTGRARYSYERRVPDVAYVAAVGATVARGRVRAVDSARALQEPGVLAVLDAASAPRLQRPEGTHPELLVLQSDAVGYRGQVVAAVVATTLEAAREGAALLEIDYEAQPHDVELRAEHPGLYVPDNANAGVPGEWSAGDVQTALRDAAVVHEATYTTAAEHHNPMEPHACTAVWEHDGLTLYNSDQGPFATAGLLAGLFGLQDEQVRVVTEYVGGGFGSKATMSRPTAVLAAMAAQVVGRPVKLALTRQQMFALISYRPPSIQRVRIGADASGRFTAIEHEAITQTSRLHEYVDQIGASTRVVYAAPHRRVVHRVVRLDVPTPGFMRGPGHASGMFALEVAVDELAERLGVDPIALRITNDTDVEPASGRPFSSRSLVEALQTGAERFGWVTRGAGTDGARPRRADGWIIGTGVAAAHHPDYRFGSTARARALPDGRFEVQIAAADIGTGARTVLLQVAADALGVGTEHIALTIGHSASGQATGAGGSMGTSSWSWPVDLACRDLARRLAERAPGEPLPADGIEVQADSAEAVRAAGELARHTFGAHFAEVAVHARTGEVRVRRMLGVFAAGTIINTRTARSQFYGGMIMAHGQALLERGEVDPGPGDFANHDLASYHIPAHADIGSLEVVMLDERDRSGHPVGVKGIGELSMMGGAAAIANALAHATGHRFRDVPIRIEDVRSVLRRQ